MILPDFLQFILLIVAIAFCTASTLFIKSPIEQTKQVEQTLMQDEKVVK